MTERQQRIQRLKSQGFKVGPQIARDVTSMRRAAAELRDHADKASRDDLPGRDRAELMLRADALELKAEELEDRHLTERAENQRRAKLNANRIPTG